MPRFVELSMVSTNTINKMNVSKIVMTSPCYSFSVSKENCRSYDCCFKRVFNIGIKQIVFEVNANSCKSRRVSNSIKFACHLVMVTTTIDNIAYFFTSAYTCPRSKSKCKDGQLCVDKDFLCDGEDDCNDGSDESEEVCKGLQSARDY